MLASVLTLSYIIAGQCKSVKVELYGHTGSGDRATWNTENEEEVFHFGISKYQEIDTGKDWTESWRYGEYEDDSPLVEQWTFQNTENCISYPNNAGFDKAASIFSWLTVSFVVLAVILTPAVIWLWADQSWRLSRICIAAVIMVSELILIPTFLGLTYHSVLTDVCQFGSYRPSGLLTSNAKMYLFHYDNANQSWPACCWGHEAECTLSKPALFGFSIVFWILSGLLWTHLNFLPENQDSVAAEEHGKASKEEFAKSACNK